MPMAILHFQIMKSVKVSIEKMVLNIKLIEKAIGNIELIIYDIRACTIWSQLIQWPEVYKFFNQIF